MLVAAAMRRGTDGPGTALRGESPRRNTLRFAGMKHCAARFTGGPSQHPVHALASDGARSVFADVGLKNPPFNMSDTAGTERGNGTWEFGAPPRGNDNLAWTQYVLDALKPGGRAIVVMPVKADNSVNPAEREIPRNLIERRDRVCRGPAAPAVLHHPGAGVALVPPARRGAVSQGAPGGRPASRDRDGQKEHGRRGRAWCCPEGRAPVASQSRTRFRHRRRAVSPYDLGPAGNARRVRLLLESHGPRSGVLVCRPARSREIASGPRGGRRFPRPGACGGRGCRCPRLGPGHGRGARVGPVAARLDRSTAGRAVRDPAGPLVHPSRQGRLVVAGGSACGLPPDSWKAGGSCFSRKNRSSARRPGSCATSGRRPGTSSVSRRESFVRPHWWGWNRRGWSSVPIWSGCACVGRRGGPGVARGRPLAAAQHQWMRNRAEATAALRSAAMSSATCRSVSRPCRSSGRSSA